MPAVENRKLIASVITVIVSRTMIMRARTAVSNTVILRKLAITVAEIIVAILIKLMRTTRIVKMKVMQNNSSSNDTNKSRNDEHIDDTNSTRNERSNKSNNTSISEQAIDEQNAGRAGACQRC